MGTLARAYLLTTCLIGLGLAAIAVGAWDRGMSLARWVEFGFLLVFGVVGAPVKVRIPGILGTLSVNFVFILLAIVDLGWAPAVLIAAAATTAQCVVGALTRPSLKQVAFSVAAVVISAWLGGQVFASGWLRAIEPATPVMLFWATAVYFLCNTMLVSGIIALTSKKHWYRTWYDNFLWTAPQFAAGALLADVLHFTNQQFGWQYLALVVPGLFLVYHSYALYMGKLEREKEQVESAMRLHLRTIEALALAIEASDDTTLTHLRRMQIYSVGIAKELGLAENEILALEAAALLHDVGKLAVPDYITNKPGRLTKEEYERLKVHPLVGAEILEAVDFPYPVVPIVRAHHERWDGSGYPHGLKGEEIPIGARILAVVDTLDALSSDRRYRRALPITEALRVVVEEKGRTLDPRVVEALERRFSELEAEAQSALSRDGRLASAGAARAADRFVSSIAKARQEFQRLHEMTHDLGNSLSVEDTFALLATRLMSLVAHDALAIFTIDGGMLTCRHGAGRQATELRTLKMPLGGGLSGWVAQQRAPIENGDPAREFGAAATELSGQLRSALAVPLEVQDKVIGVLTLYREEEKSFSHDDLRLLLAIGSKAALTIENALSFQRVEKSAGTDQLTGLPNAAALFEHLEREVARARATDAPLGVVVIDLDGFKQVNDRFGHLEGNRVLQLAAAGFRAHCRDSDYVARMGGDEFVVVLPQITGDALDERIQLLMAAVEEAGQRVCGERLVSLSAGTALFPEHGTTVEALLEMADKRMYAVKQEHHLANPQLQRAETLPVA